MSDDNEALGLTKARGHDIGVKTHLSVKKLTFVAEDWQMLWYHLSLRCCSAWAAERVPSANTPSDPCWLSQKDSFCHQRVFTDDACVKAFLTSLSEGTSLSLLTNLSSICANTIAMGLFLIHVKQSHKE